MRERLHMLFGDRVFGARLACVTGSLLLLCAGCGGPPDPPLIQAAASGDEAKVSALLASGADVNQLNATHELSPLHVAVGCRHIAVVKMLLDHGADPNLGGTEFTPWKPPLYTAVRLGDEAIAELLLSRGAHVDGRGAPGITPLLWAVDHGRVGMVRLLIAHGADVNARDTSMRTPLHWAAAMMHESVVGRLRGFPPDKLTVLWKGDDGENVVLYKGDHGVTVFRGDFPKTEEDLGLEPDCELKIMRVLLANGADPNAQDSRGFTPLHYAAGCPSCLDRLRLLLANGADPNIADNDGRKPLSLASGEEERRILREHGATE